MRSKKLTQPRRNRLLTGLSGVLLLLGGQAFAQAPPNDECTGAELLPGSAPFPPYTTSVDATNATLNDSDPLLSCNDDGTDDGSQTVWYVYTPDNSGFVNISTDGSTEAGGGELDTAHGAFTGSCATLTQVMSRLSKPPSGPGSKCQC